MKRILSEDEKIRKAEEIYYRRNHKNLSIPEIKSQKTKTYLGSKILLEMLILLITAMTIFAVKNKNYIFSSDFLNNLSQYNINLNEKVGWLVAEFRGEEYTNSKEELPDDSVETQELVETQAQEKQQSSAESVVVDETKFIKPVKGMVTSGFGSRETMNKNVPINHTGIDIGAEPGTEIKSAIHGLVVQVSSEGDYGNHVKIADGETGTLYAHCNDIYVQEGQEIQIGQIIGTVGSTGNSTGPHLHFEIRKNDVPVNPADYIEF